MARHRAEQLVEDEHREITERDIDDSHADQDERQPETETKVREEAPRRRPADATPEVVDRAALALSTGAANSIAGQRRMRVRPMPAATGPVSTVTADYHAAIAIAADRASAGLSVRRGTLPR